MKPMPLAAVLFWPAVLTAQSAAPGYRVGIVSESGDIVSWFTPGAGTLTAHHVVPVGIMPADIDGPHNLAVSPDSRFYYVSIAHGTPFGTLWKMDAKADTLVGRAPLEMFPTTIGLTPDGELAFVANSDFHGDHPRMNVISVVHTPTMTTLTALPACDMPHGVKSNHAGTSVYISCMMSDELLEIEVGTFRIIRRAKTGVGHSYAGMAGMDHGSMNHGAPAPAPPAAATAPTARTRSRAVSARSAEGSAPPGLPPPRSPVASRSPAATSSRAAKPSRRAAAPRRPRSATPGPR